MTMNERIHVLMKENYKFENNLSPPLIDDMFHVRKTNYHLRHFQKFANSKMNSVKMGLKTISYCVPELWNLVSTEIKDAPSLSIFKDKIKSWNYDNCPCILCKTYFANVGFVLVSYFRNWLTSLIFSMVFCRFSVSCFIDARCKLVL